MDGERDHIVHIEQTSAELFPRNPYCLNEGRQCGCRLPNVTIHPQWATGRRRSLWKTFLLCLSACLAAAALVLVVYFVHLGKPANSTTVVIHADGKASRVTCLPRSTPSPAASALPGSSTPVAAQSSSARVSPSSMETAKITTPEHEVVIEENSSSP